MTTDLKNGDVLNMLHPLADKLQLSTDEQAVILAVSTDDYQDLALKSDQPASSGLLVRINQLARIVKAVEAIAPQGHSETFLTNPNMTPPLNGASIREYLLTRNTDDEVETLARWLSSKVHGSYS